jgi:AraC family transcriptional regulator, regulatory protein of adaptative response / methylated-DNA-[protein]-cysteine methyltransferase
MLFGTAPAVRVQEANVINGELADRQKSGGIGRPPARLSYNTLIHPRWEIAPLPKHETQEHDISSIMTLKPKPQPVADDPRWARIVARDKTADGHLWYSVSTTGVYCRPSCPSRVANPSNVQLHDTLKDAKATGFRPCRRCNPDGRSIESENAALVARACRIIEQSEDVPSLAELADAFGRSPSYFHRIFTAATGLTPKDYAAANRAKRVRQGLAYGNTVTETIYEAGFNSSGRFYEKATDILGMTPSQYRSGGVNEEIRFAVGQTSLGVILVASSKKGVASILLGDDPDELVRNLQDRFPRAHLIGADQHYEALVARVVGLVEAPGIGVDLPLDVRCTAFEQRVWQALQQIPAGQTISYAEIAQRIGSPKAARAVARACAANNLALAIPCHRVVRKDGAPSGYAWGAERKRELLDREGRSGTC